MTLKDVVEYIRDAIAITYENKSIPVFTEKSITDLYNDRLMYHGSQYNSIDAVASAWNTRATRMREKIQEKIPGFCIAKKGREVTLNIDDEVGQVLYAANGQMAVYGQMKSTITVFTITITVFSKTLYATIIKNNLTLFIYTAEVIVSKEKSKLQHWKSMYLSLYIGWKSWQADLDEFLCQENHKYLPSLSDYGKIWKPTPKSYFLRCLYQE